MGDLVDKSQKQWMKSWWISYKQNKMPEILWSRVSDMVSFYNSDVTSLKEDGSVPVGTDCTLSPVAPREMTPPEPPVKRLVCSPDLPVFEERPSSSSPDKIYQCSFCNKTFPQKNTYQNHLRSHSKEGEDPYQCNMCGKTFAVPARLTRHYRTHTGEKPYQCEYCNKSFSVKENLSVHRRIHTKERPYKCDVCERAFEHSGKLHRHMRIHTGERPHKCNVCSKTFIQSGQLVIHMRTHTGEKPYVCKVCAKGFTCSKQLKVHTRTHTGEKPYNCDICGKSFGYNHVLKLHQVAHYGEKVYKCTICKETFTSKKTMELHIKSHSEQSQAPPPSMRPAGQSSDVGETLSCASSASDKENKAESDTETRTVNVVTYEEPEKMSLSPLEIILSPPTMQTIPETSQKHPNMKELCYYLYYPRTNERPSYKEAQGVNPALLAAAAAAAASEGSLKVEMEEPRLQYEQEQYVEQTHFEDIPLRVTDSSSGPIEPSVYLCPDPLASMNRRCSPYPPELLGEGLEIQDKQGLSPVLTPPSSNPVSPAPSTSPDPLDLAPIAREILILPPRKRSKMILKSLETETSRLRQNSVIHFARASSLHNT